MTVPTIVFLLIGGVVSDRLRPSPGDDRAPTLARGLAVGRMAVLALTGALELWHIVVLVGRVRRRARRSSRPAFDAIVPERPARRGARRRPTRSTRSCARWRCASPARRSAACWWASPALALPSRSTRPRLPSRPPRSWRMRARAAAQRAPGRRASVRGDLAEGFALRAPPRVAVGDVRRGRGRLPAVHGARPRCCCPFVVQNELDGSAADLGLVFAAGGLGSVGCALVDGPARAAARDDHVHVRDLDAGDARGRRLRARHAIWQLMLVSLVFNVLETAGTIVWATAKQRHVPATLLGRVSSLDWLISIGLLPLSFALTGPVERGDRRAGDADRSGRARRDRHARRAARARHARRRGASRPGSAPRSACHLRAGYRCAAVHVGPRRDRSGR